MADPTLYLYTSLTAGSSHIITATSRLETILKANKIPFRALDVATDDKARSLWGRRSRGRKLPGLVKFGQVIGDLDQIEEWNEFGELHEQIESADDFLDGSAAPVNPNAISLRPEPAPGVANQLTPIQPAPGGIKKDPKATSATSSLASSETRHISITEPTALEREGRSPIATPSENPMTMTMRQLGAEAAARAKDRKTSGAIPKSVPVSSPSAKSDIPLSPPAATTDAKEREASDPSQAPEVTAAKAPAQLAAEGVKRTSVDKIEAASASTGNTTTSTSIDSDARKDSGPTSPGTASTEEQLLNLRRQSTQTAVPSKLAESVSAAPEGEPTENETPASDAIPKTDEDPKIDSDVEPPVAEANTDATPDGGRQTSSAQTAEPTDQASSDQPASKAAEVDAHAPAAASLNAPSSDLGSNPEEHIRDSSIVEADKSKVKEVEQSIKIDERPEEEAKSGVEDSTETSVSKPSETPKGSSTEVPETASKTVEDEEKLVEPQKGDAKDSEAATESVKD
ncbi:uncharacterized protein AB675_6882 [Cyphellophora attinorum]|uniref:Uncharacterized protein n=1 Tax=Cyphellophora attinorum TaxID=1664694 RepID=A0A0N0NQ27_9EURO|nr:uncharacterized protein AB675_6882 [Phialophora attinorum]KPI43209.1 hypothetical protein AB675_6882 [Phialophora attinorum]